LPALADDSGLAVDVLGGAPGIFSARWAGRHGDDRANLELLLAQVSDVRDEHRGAGFVCAAVLALPDGRRASPRATSAGHADPSAARQQRFWLRPDPARRRHPHRGRVVARREERDLAPRQGFPGATYAVDGLTAGIGGLAVASLGAIALDGVGAVGGEAMPLAAVGSAFVDRTPLWLKTLAVQAFGTSDKTALWIGMALVILAVLAGIGALARTRHTLALVCLGALGALVVAAVVTREGARVTDVLPTLVGVTGAILWLHGRARGASSAEAGDEDPVAATRRAVLRLGAATAGFAATSWWWARGTGPTLDDVRDQIVLPAPVSSEPDVTAADLRTPGAVPWQVPTGDFYRIDTALIVPRSIRPRGGCGSRRGRAGSRTHVGRSARPAA
jgi:hypothetical protein